MRRGTDLLQEGSYPLKKRGASVLLGQKEKGRMGIRGYGLLQLHGKECLSREKGVVAITLYGMKKL